MEPNGATITYIFTGVVGEHGIIPRNATRVIIHDSVTAIPLYAFGGHPNIVEVICHDGVLKINRWAFHECPRLKRVIMPGVKVILKFAFSKCRALTYVECGKLEKIMENAFDSCESLPEINLPSVIEVYQYAFVNCKSITKATFGEDLDSIRQGAFKGCSSLERITVPLKDDMLDSHSFFRSTRLQHVDLVEGEELRETISSLLIDEWRDDMKVAMDSIKQIVPYPYVSRDDGRNNAEVFGIGGDIQRWIRSVRLKIICYKAQHGQLLNKASKIIEEGLPEDIVMNNIVPFLELPAHIFEGEGLLDWGFNGNAPPIATQVANVARQAKRGPSLQLRPLCCSVGCRNQARKGGVCIRHGAKRKRCSSEGCTNQAVKGGVCIRHGAKRKQCSSEGCTNQAYIGGVCIRHGAKRKQCSSEGCTNQAYIGGVCIRHGAT